jgi:hypothetical protein
MSESQEPTVQGPIIVEEPKYDDAQIQHAIDQLRNEQNLLAGTMAGVVAALIGAGLWAAITVATKFQIGFMAIGVGFLVGIAIRTVGKGVDNSFGVVGAILALLGCGLGNLLALCGLAAAEHGGDVGMFDVVKDLTPAIALDAMVATFSPIDLLFYGIAAYEGYRLSFRQLTTKQIIERMPDQKGAG